ncbi:MAG: hypothetical protein FJZ78_06645 [Bacteroidetes bacterium]|nr:hypothetical protein [Bacteroidota bacterium]
MTKEGLELLKNRIIEGLKIARERVIAFKKQKGTDMVILKDGEIFKYKPK